MKVASYRDKKRKGNFGLIGEPVVLDNGREIQMFKLNG
jgi:hypothetical protein